MECLVIGATVLVGEHSTGGQTDASKWHDVRRLRDKLQMILEFSRIARYLVISVRCVPEKVNGFAKARDIVTDVIGVTNRVGPL
jgi:hypothetical protein